ncbi:MAG: hypothetical protein U9Q04_05035 [Campylobacterota bacterium]|nr:hypothetical protein [Campylobacterota bacterium]
MGDMMIPFIMLLIVTIALVLERKHHEDKIVDIYEDKFDKWKEHHSGDEVKAKVQKELVGLVFLEDEKLNIELLDNKVQDRLERKKYTIKDKS